MKYKYLFSFLSFLSILSPAKSQVCVALDSWTMATDHNDGTCTYDITTTINSANGATGVLVLTLDGNTVYTDANCTCNPVTVTFPVTVNCGATINIDANYDAPGNGNDCSGSTGNIVLPIEWISTDVSQQDGYNEVSWTVIENAENDKYIIERSQNGRNFEQIGTQINEGVYDVISRYSFVDDKPAKGVNYYRIKQIDLDGIFSYSEIVYTKNQSVRDISVYPNPFTDIIILDSEFVDSWSISSIYGEFIKRGNTTQIDGAALQSGIYYLQIVNGSEIIGKIIIKN